jgi:hypothetical protein
MSESVDEICTAVSASWESGIVLDISSSILSDLSQSDMSLQTRIQMKPLPEEEEGHFAWKANLKGIFCQPGLVNWEEGGAISGVGLLRVTLEGCGISSHRTFSAPRQKHD